MLAMTVWLAGGAAHAETVRVGGTGSALQVMQILGDAYRRIDPQFELKVVPNLGSSGGLRALAGGAIEAALTGRDVNDEERRAGLSAFTYGRTPLVLATSRPNPPGLTLAEIADIYAGRRDKWPDGTPIRLVLRPPSDIDTRTLAAMSPAIAAALEQAAARPGMLVPVTDQESADDLARLRGSLGTSSLALILAEKRPLHVLTIAGVVPSAKSVGDGSYPHAKTMYLVVRGVPAGALAGFIGFVRSPAGKAILEQTGHWVGSGAAPPAPSR
jgi:phosphate transport system substrate-binding protein